jgi:hypothetical protein
MPFEEIVIAVHAAERWREGGVVVPAFDRWMDLREAVASARRSAMADASLAASGRSGRRRREPWQI